MNPNWNHQLNPRANAGSPFYDQYAYDQFDAAQGWNVVHPEVRNFPGFSYNGSMIPSQRHESSSVPREFEVEQVASASESKSSKGKGKAPAKATYDKWTSEEQSFLVDLWAEKHERLESKDARKRAIYRTQNIRQLVSAVATVSFPDRVFQTLEMGVHRF
ncbi:hypothetical protein QZH41_006885 [Actinostola sp. cb2023]|nr:hypothetical protein QZH41_006885 [Actinostola sp. cb2023]